MLRFLHLAWHIKPLAFLGLSATGFLAAPAFIRPVPPPPVYCPAPAVVAPYYRPEFRVVDRWAPVAHYRHHHEFVERHFHR